MNPADISAADMEALKEQGYAEGDMEMLAESEVAALLMREEGAPAAEDKPAADAPAADAPAADAEPEGDKPDRAFTPTYTTDDVPEDAADRIKALRDEEKEAHRKLMDGEIDDAEYQEVRDRTETERDELKEKVLKAAIFKQANEQTAQQLAQAEWKRAETAAMSSFKSEGLDYRSKPGLLAAYNTNLKALAADSKNENRDAKWFLEEAHRLTKDDLGIVTKPKNIPTPHATRVDSSEIPPTLRGTPASATGAIDSDEFSNLRTLMDTDPLAYERAHAALTEAQRDRWMAAA